MTVKSKLLIFAALIIIALIVVILSYYYPVKTITPPSGQGEEVLPKATGNVDDAADAVLQELTDVETIISDIDSDVSLITDDEQEISDFGQSYNENEF